MNPQNVCEMTTQRKILHLTSSKPKAKAQTSHLLSSGEQVFSKLSDMTLKLVVSTDAVWAFVFIHQNMQVKLAL